MNKNTNKYVKRLERFYSLKETNGKGWEVIKQLTPVREMKMSDELKSILLGIPEDYRDTVVEEWLMTKINRVSTNCECDGRFGNQINPDLCICVVCGSKVTPL